MTWRGPVAALLTLLLTAGAPAAAQVATAQVAAPADSAPSARAGLAAALPAGAWTVGAWAGAALHSPVHGHLGATGGRNYFTAALRVGRVLTASRHFAVEYTADLIPVAVVTETPYYRTDRLTFQDGRQMKVFWPTGEGPVYGAGLAPVGMRFHLAATPRVRLVGSFAGGGLWFTRNTPVPSARRFNFTAEAGGGAELVVGAHTLAAGYKLHHMSNGYTASANPGLDGHILYLGVTRLWSRPE
jgi:hypothetical protein